MRVSTAIHNGSGLVVEEGSDTSSRANEDVIVTDVRRRGEYKTRIINIHDQMVMHSGERLTLELSRSRVSRHGGTVLGEDSN